MSEAFGKKYLPPNAKNSIENVFANSIVTATQNASGSLPKNLNLCPPPIPAEREEIARELAGYLEDLCSDAPSHNLDDSAAMQIAAAELHEDKHLGAHLSRARREGTMNDRTKQLWLPALTILLASVAALTIFQIAGFSPYFPHFWSARFGSTDVWLRYSFFIYVPWLCVLPFLGGAGAYWSRRAGSTRAASIVAGIFPVSVFLAAFVVFVPVALAVGTLPPAKIFLPALAAQILSWVIIPGAALLVGIVPFLTGSNAPRRLFL